ncbi:MAG: HDIG domain-containing protein [Chloroflexi bacterium]|nr:HDIG domain-containing protein [Chloroflexota bacterium]
MTRDEALVLLREYVKSPTLINHCLGVEAAMRAYAPRYDGDPDTWGLTGLLHDFDWEIHPDAERHPAAGASILREHGIPEDVIYAIQGHATYLNVPRSHPMDQALFACDELVGLITAVTYVRPSRNIADVDVAAVRKKMKDKAFARNVNRQDIIDGAAELGVALDEHIAFVVAAMQAHAAELGLAG